MMPTRSDFDEFYKTVEPHHALRITMHFGGDANIADPNSPKRQSTSGRYVVWVGNKFAKSDKSLTHAATLAIKQLGGNTC